MTIEFKGLDGLTKKLDGITDPTLINAALGKACALVERSAKIKAPKDTGELRRSITSKVEDGEGMVFTPLEYAEYVEYGTGLFAEQGGRTDTPWTYKDDKGEWHTTSGQPPQPFLRPDLAEHRDQRIRIIKEGIRE